METHSRYNQSEPPKQPFFKLNLMSLRHEPSLLARAWLFWQQKQANIARIWYCRCCYRCYRCYRCCFVVYSKERKRGKMQGEESTCPTNASNEFSRTKGREESTQNNDKDNKYHQNNGKQNTTGQQAQNDKKTRQAAQRTNQHNNPAT